MTAKDIEAGQVRIPIGPTKALLPADRGYVEIVLRGRNLTCRWDPRFGTDRERLGLIGVGRETAAEILKAGDTLQVTVMGSTVHLQ